jgi:arsenate reductase
MSRQPVVLFVCVHNAGRSQMAAAWLRHLGRGRVDVRSAGSAPGERVHPQVVEVLRAITDADLREADVVVTMGCGDACVARAGARREDWALADPKGLDLAGTRVVRDQVRAHVERLLASLGLPA